MDYFLLCICVPLSPLSICSKIYFVQGIYCIFSSPIVERHQRKKNLLFNHVYLYGLSTACWSTSRHPPLWNFLRTSCCCTLTFSSFPFIIFYSNHGDFPFACLLFALTVSSIVKLFSIFPLLYLVFSSLLLFHFYSILGDFLSPACWCHLQVLPLWSFPRFSNCCTSGLVSFSLLVFYFFNLHSVFRHQLI